MTCPPHEVRPTADVRTDAAVLAARGTVALALAAALREPLPAGGWGRLGTAPPALAAGGRAGEAFPIDVVGPAWELVVEDWARRASGEPPGFAELAPGACGVEPLVRWLRAEAEWRARAWTCVFGAGMPRDCPPCETEYCESRDAFHRAQHMADAAGFYRAFGLMPDPRRPQRADHISVVLSFVAHLLSRLADVGGSQVGTGLHVCEEALRQFVRDHVAWWVPVFGRGMEARARAAARLQDDFRLAAVLTDLAGVARLLRGWSGVERVASGIEPGRRISTAPAWSDADGWNDECGVPECDDCSAACAGTTESGLRPPPARPPKR